MITACMIRRSRSSPELGGEPGHPRDDLVLAARVAAGVAGHLLELAGPRAVSAARSGQQRRELVVDRRRSGRGSPPARPGPGQAISTSGAPLLVVGAVGALELDEAVPGVEPPRARVLVSKTHSPKPVGTQALDQVEQRGADALARSGRARRTGSPASRPRARSSPTGTPSPPRPPRPRRRRRRAGRASHRRTSSAGAPAAASPGTRAGAGREVQRRPARRRPRASPAQPARSGAGVSRHRG